MTRSALVITAMVTMLAWAAPVVAAPADTDRGVHVSPVKAPRYVVRPESVDIKFGISNEGSRSSQGVRVTVKDVDGDGRADIVTGSGAYDAPAVNVYLATALAASSSPSAHQTFDPFGGALLPGGVWVG